MPVRISAGELRPDIAAQERPAPIALSDGMPFRIGILGDFRGAGRAQVAGSARGRNGRGWIAIDRDGFDQVMARLGVSLQLALPGAEGTRIALSFQQMDDFHPDRIVERSELFHSLLEMRRRLADPATFDAAAEALGARRTEGARPAEPATPPTSAPPPTAKPAVVGSSAELLDLIVQQKEGSPTPAPVLAPGALTELVENIVAPYIVHTDPRQAELVAGVDAAMAGLLRDILHHPEFQALEAVWRGLHLLTRRLDTGPALTIDLIDTTRTELEADLIAATPLESTRTYKRLVEATVGTEGGQPWALLVGNFAFAPAPRDVALLWRLGQIARLAGAPFVAAADARFAGSTSLAESADPDDWAEPPAPDGWASLRQSADAPYLGLVLPRILLRAPYGPETVPIHTFAFQEFTGQPNHESYLWGNPALAVALLVGRAFATSGWSWLEGYDPELGQLPLVVERVEGEAVSKPCAEVLLGRRAVSLLLEHGLMPLVSVRDGDSAQLAEIRSVAYPPCALAIREAST